MQKTSRLSRVIYISIAVFALAGLIMPTTPQKTYANQGGVCGDVYDPVPSWLTTRINQNKSVYQQASNATGVPWELIAAIHYREYNNATTNPANGQGIYQLWSVYNSSDRKVRDEYRKLASPNTTVTDANFLKQTIWAAEFIQEKARYTSYTPTTVPNPRKLTKNESDLDLIKSTLFSYNGRASSYANQAQKYGFSRTTHPFEGSPYVMSKFDCERRAMGLITTDGSNSLTATDTRMGAFTLYARLKSDSYWKSLQPVTTYSPLDTPRWMVTDKELHKIDLRTGLPYGNPIPAGTELYFPDKSTFVGTTYLRTQYDSERNLGYGIAFPDLSNITPEYSLLPDDGWKVLTKNSNYLDPTTEASAGGRSLSAGTELFFSSKTTVGGKLYYRTKNDTDNNINRAFLASDIKEVDLRYTPLKSPTAMIVSKPTYRQNVINQKSIGLKLTSGSELSFVDSVKVGGLEYWRTAEDKSANLNQGVLRSSLNYPEPIYEDIEDPQTRRATSSVVKLSLTDSEPTDIKISKNQDVTYQDRTTIDGVTYLRSEYDARRGNHLGVVESRIKPIEDTLVFVPLDTPRTMVVNKNGRKIDMLTLGRSGNIIPSGSRIMFTTKIRYNGEWHLRSAYDTSRGWTTVIPFSELRNI